ncbi:MAG: site-specific integrase [Oscillospiraceae bacterium]|nr:site-specific integrase [Oscillospiraceae bacterium]
MAGKRANGEGSVRLRPEGRWEVTMMIGYYDDGKPKRHSIYGRTQKSAIEKAAEYRRQIENGKIIDKRLTLSEYAERWYKEYKGQVKLSTYAGYRFTLMIINQTWGKKRLCDIKPSDVENGLKKMVEEDRSRSVVTKVKAMLHQILRKAEANGIIDKNPVPLTQKTKMKTPPSKKDSLSLTEVGILYQELPDTRAGHAIRLSIACGIRTQELLALTPEHIDLENGELCIEQAIFMVRGSVHLGETKSAAGVRKIPIPPIAKESAVFLKNNGKKFIFQGRNEKPMNPSTYRNHYNAAFEMVKDVRLLPPHCMRHTYITLMQASGVPVETIKTLAGHSDKTTTLGYMHIKDEVTAQAAVALSKTLEQASKK